MGHVMQLGVYSSILLTAQVFYVQVRIMCIISCIHTQTHTLDWGKISAVYLGMHGNLQPISDSMAFDGMRRCSFSSRAMLFCYVSDVISE